MSVSTSPATTAGGRVAYRIALDHPERVDRLAVLDVLPIDATWDRADARLARGTTHLARKLRRKRLGTVGVEVRERLRRHVERVRGFRRRTDHEPQRVRGGVVEELPDGPGFHE